MVFLNLFHFNILKGGNFKRNLILDYIIGNMYMYIKAFIILSDVGGGGGRKTETIIFLIFVKGYKQNLHMDGS